VASSRAIHFDGCVLTYEPRWGDELPGPQGTDAAPDGEARTDSEPGNGLVGRIALGIAIALLRQTIFSSATTISRDMSRNALHLQPTSEGVETGKRHADCEHIRR